MKEFKIVPIPPKMEKYYGTGTILHPSLSEIEELVRQIPERKVTTINHLTHYLAKTHDTDTTCPLRTGNAIKKIAIRFNLENLDQNLPFWRVLRSDNLIIRSKGYEQWAAILEKEGFELKVNNSGNIKVILNEDDIFSFEDEL